MNAARDAILARVRAALRDVPEAERADDVAVARDYRTEGTLPHAEVVALFAENCADYRANVREVDAAGLPGAIAEALAARGARRLAIPADLPAQWRAGDGVEWVEDHGLSHDALSAVDGVVTGCAVAVALNGTIALDGGVAQGRRALTLLPDYHLCVVHAEQVVELVPEGIARLREAALAGQPMTIVAGPSATSDIEFNRVEGVHGPRTLDVLVVTG
ncbi:LUD domain-containing protein [Conexibacter sp. JD483]|uniref:LutC/YkgG family protein n=1 Tax=unclassified Conexibacter TaxID=2627773 RepID=UPI002723DA70|nr:MULTISPECIES: LUD domain-containing protein [unclassified Conexibacter]MDO8184956.1 LUD domain-containing protein [Conexibacter sp. CPCC 205706]MDO8198100.1 LUD domain-containing protein [Conexibacter sp. CPCC 205762]MDR9368278.1 LUD domain-containing protein [Conexibacter sp. JD483]